jgi:uncharacterized membrane protein
MNKTTRTLIIWSSVIFLLNFLFKLYRISAPSLWYDEIISANDTLLDFGHIKHEAEWDKNPPFYHYVLWIWSKFFGVSELALRSMSVFFNSMTAVVIFLFVTQLSSQLKGILSSIIFSVHPFLFYYAQEARCYSFLMFLVIVNLVLLYRYINTPSYWNAFLVGFTNFLMFYTHYLTALLIFCQFVYIIFYHRRSILLLAVIYLTPVVLVLVRFTQKQYQVLFFSQEMSRAKSNVPLAELVHLDLALNQMFTSYLILIVFLLVAFYFFIKKGTNPSPNRSFKGFIIILPLACIILLFLLGKWTNVFHERYLIFCMPYIFISLFLPVSEKLMMYVIFAFTLFIELYHLKFNQSKRMDYKFAAYLAKEIKKKNDLNIIIQTHDVISLFMYYYDREKYLSKSSTSPEVLRNENIYYIDTYEDFLRTGFDTLKPVLLLQTYQKLRDEDSIEEYFNARKYSRFTTKSIENVKLTYLNPIN